MNNAVPCKRLPISDVPSPVSNVQPLVTEGPVRRGSALIIVLGLLSVLMLMAVAFSVSMRLERASSANQRNASAGGLQLESALMTAIGDLDRMPEAHYPNPPWFIMPSKTLDARPELSILDVDATSKPPLTNGTFYTQIGFPAMKDILPPDQWKAALMAVPPPQWRPIVDARSLGGTTNDYLGRFAYVIINTTGLLDINHVGGLARGAGTSPGEISIASLFPGGDVPTREANATRFTQKRNANNGYVSMSEFMRLSYYDNVNNNKTGYEYNRTTLATTHFTNYFNTYSYAPADLAIHVEPPTNSFDLNVLNVTNRYGKRFGKINVNAGELLLESGKHSRTNLLEQFRKVFDDTSMRVLVGSGPLYIPMSRIAALALLDYRDDNSIPGRGGDVTSGTFNYLDDLANYPTSSTLPWETDPLCYPCTEAIPMIDRLYVVCNGRNVSTNYTSETLPGGDTKTTTNIVSDLSLKFVVGVTCPDYDKLKLASTADRSFNVELKVMNGMNKIIFPGASSSSGFTVTGENWAYPVPFTYRTNVGYSAEALAMEPRTNNNPDVRITVTYDIEQENNTVYVGGVFRVTASVWDQNGNKLQEVPALNLCRNNLDDFIALGFILTPSIVKEINDKVTRVQDFYGLDWAVVNDPRFAFSPKMWIKRISCTSRFGITSTYDATEILPTQTAVLFGMIDSALLGLTGGGDMISPSVVNYFTRYLLQNNIAVPEILLPRPASLSNPTNHYPDHIWYGTTSDDTISNAGESTAAHNTYIANGGFTSIGEMGNLVIAPLRTINLFESDVTPSIMGVAPPPHKVIDRFSVNASSVGHVNINPNPANKNGNALDFSALSLVFADMPLNAKASNPSAQKRLTDAELSSLTNVLQSTYMNLTPTNANANVTNVIYNMSVLANAKVLSEIKSWKINSSTKKAQSKHDRESVLSNSLGLFHNRGQTYTILLCADSSTDLSAPVSAATSFAIAEIWRDPEPVRDTDPNHGDAFGRPIMQKGQYMRPDLVGGQISENIAVHPWKILYFRQF